VKSLTLLSRNPNSAASRTAKEDSWPHKSFSIPLCLQCPSRTTLGFPTCPMLSPCYLDCSCVPVTVSTAGTAVLPPSIPWHFVLPAQIRVLLLLGFVLLLAIARDRLMFDSALRARRLASCGALAATLLCTVLYAAACGSTASLTTTAPPRVVTPSGTSTITMSAMSPTQQPLQLPPMQLTLTVK
jgi:hypothetical protein